MPRNKLDRFQDIAEFEHVLEYTDFKNGSPKPKGRWKGDIFGNQNPIVLELACGKGSYTLNLARKNHHKNFVGIDIKGARIWKGAQKSLDDGLTNVRFLRIFIDHLNEYFDAAEVDDIWITFPDPYLKKSDENKRLTSSKFLSIYQKVLKPGGSIRLKTDNDELFAYTKKEIEENGCKVLDVAEDIYKERPQDPWLTIKTDFEKKHLEKGRIISFISFTLPDQPIN
ncbi:MAG TPA: tRNA (guanosine(46)-N7)-methyltransferase TrmB [Balneolaceae bacterium]|nr:tRNA (guanosine(46)-N7)-methyltransferase TrmB [Balneolaceae bacterium]